MNIDPSNHCFEMSWDRGETFAKFLANTRPHESVGVYGF